VAFAIDRRERQSDPALQVHGDEGESADSRSSEAAER
jgi:hypothetical protein